MPYQMTRMTVVDVKARDVNGKPCNTNFANERVLDCPFGHKLAGFQCIESNDDVHLICIWKPISPISLFWVLVIVTCVAIPIMGWLVVHGHH